MEICVLCSQPKRAAYGGGCPCGSTSFVETSPAPPRHAERPAPPLPLPAARVPPPLPARTATRPQVGPSSPWSSTPPPPPPASPAPSPPTTCPALTAPFRSVAPRPPREAPREEQRLCERVERETLRALGRLGFDAAPIGTRLTPNSVLVRVHGTSKLTVEAVAKRRSQFVTTHRVPLVSVFEELGAVVLAVARPQRELVRLEDVWRRWAPATEGGNTALLVGVREADGELLVLDPATVHAPHTLIAGTTGSGKSVLMHNLLLSIAATNTPAEAQIVLIDPKYGLDFAALEDLPHLGDGIISERPAALDRLHDLVVEMEQRFKRLKARRVTNLADYNAAVDPEDRLPRIWAVHDEFAAWMLDEDYAAGVAGVVQKLSAKARAAGIHLIFAAQRPEANVVPPQLRDNLGNRLVLRVASRGTSKIALLDVGAEDLLGDGHLLARLEGAPGLVYAQVPLASGAFVERMVARIMAESGADAADGGEDGDEDEDQHHEDEGEDGDEDEGDEGHVEEEDEDDEAEDD